MCTGPPAGPRVPVTVVKTETPACPRVLRGAGRALEGDGKRVPASPWRGDEAPVCWGVCVLCVACRLGVQSRCCAFVPTDAPRAVCAACWEVRGTRTRSLFGR